MGYIDCDSHVIETEETWSYLDPGEREYRPTTMYLEGVSSAGNSAPKPATADSPVPRREQNQFWLLGDTWARRFPDNSSYKDNAYLYDPGATQLSDVSVRLADLDALGIDVQLVFSTCFISTELDHPLCEAALTRSYNRWVAERTADAGGRLVWALRPPLRMIDRALEELEFGATHGAAGIHLRGIEHGFRLSDPWFYPLYERAQDLDLAILVHVGTATRRKGVPVAQLLPTPSHMVEEQSAALAGFLAVLHSDLYVRFPKLRFGFLESGASWLPYMINRYLRLKASYGFDFLEVGGMTPDEFAERNIYVACETTEDIPYLVNLVGRDRLVAGTDYVHNDLATELGALWSIDNRKDLDPDAARRIVDDNGRSLLRVGAEFKPAPERPSSAELPPHVRWAPQDGDPVLVART